MTLPFLICLAFGTCIVAYSVSGLVGLYFLLDASPWLDGSLYVLKVSPTCFTRHWKIGRFEISNSAYVLCVIEIYKNVLTSKQI